MSRLRVIIRVITLSVVTAGMYALYLLVLAFLFPFGDAALWWRKFMFRKWAKATASIIGMKLTTRGRAPETPFFLVSNHLSYIDVIAFATQSDCVFIARGDVARWPVIGLLSRAAHTIFIDRTRRKDIPRVIDRIEKVMGTSQGVVLFAEGTSSEGARVLPFNPSLLEPAARAGFPVSYASISYRTPPGQVPANLSVCWWGDMTFVSHLLDLFRIPRFYATLVFGQETISDGDRKSLARRLQLAVEGQFTPVVGLEEECSARIF